MGPHSLTQCHSLEIGGDLKRSLILWPAQTHTDVISQRNLEQLGAQAVETLYVLYKTFIGGETRVRTICELGVHKL